MPVINIGISLLAGIANAYHPGLLRCATQGFSILVASGGQSGIGGRTPQCTAMDPNPPISPST